MFESDAAAAVLRAKDFSSSQMESDAKTEFLFSTREKLEMRRRRKAAKVDMIANTCNNVLKIGFML